MTKHSSLPPKPLILGLAGGTGSGKTTLGKKLSQEAGAGHVVILPQDAYYHAQQELPFEVRALTNYDEPSAFDTGLLAEHLDALLRGEDVARPVYDFAAHTRSAETLTVTPCAVVIVEGILVLHEPTLRERMKLRVFVDAPPDERFIRRLERDVSERGRSAESVISQYRRTVKPMHDLFIEPTKKYADLIVPEGGRNSVALDVLSAYIARVVLEKEAKGSQ